LTERVRDITLNKDVVIDIQEDSWRHLALEVVVTLCETAPAMVRKVAGAQIPLAVQVRVTNCHENR
jgi:hypothetical protein